MTGTHDDVDTVTYTYGDSFTGADGASPNVNIWGAETGNIINGNKLKNIRAIGDSYSEVKSVFTETGNFTVSIDWSSLSHSGGDFGFAVRNVIVWNEIPTDRQYRIYIKQGTGLWWLKYEGSYSSGSIGVGPGTYGAFQIKRSGSTIYVYYKVNDAASWTLGYTFSSASTDPMYPYFFVYNSVTTSPEYWHIDNFVSDNVILTETEKKTTLRHLGYPFKSLGARPGLAIENETTGEVSTIATASEDGYITTTDNIEWSNGDTYKIYKTATKGSLISTNWVDLSRGWKSRKSELKDGWRDEDIDLDKDNPGKVFGPGQPSRSHR